MENNAPYPVASVPFQRTPEPKKPLKRFFKPVLLCIVIVLLALLGAFYFNLLPIKFLQKVIPTQSTVASSNILFPSSGYDPSGRDIYYIHNDSGQTGLPFSGVGLFYYPAADRFTTASGKYQNGANVVQYITASFVKWEPIPGSKDRYMDIKDNLGVMNMQTGTPALPIDKIRIPFSDDNGEKVTDMRVQDLQNIIPKTIPSQIDSGNGAKSYDMGPITAFSGKQLDTLIQPNDALGFIVPHDVEFHSQRDDQGYFVVSQIVLRRFDPKTELAKELGETVVIQ